MPQEFSQLVTQSLADDAGPGSPQERDAVLDILAEHNRGRDLSGSPLTATYILDSQGDPRCLAITVHEMVGRQHFARNPDDRHFHRVRAAAGRRRIALEPATTNWQRLVAALRSPCHPSRSPRKSRLLARELDRGNCCGWQSRTPPKRQASDDLARMSSVLTNEQTSQVDEARRRLQLAIDEILLAALGRTIAATIGDGVVAVDLEGHGRPVLKPDVDLRRTVGWFTTIFPVPTRLRKRRERKCDGDIGRHPPQARCCAPSRNRTRVCCGTSTHRPRVYSAPNARPTSSSPTRARSPTCHPAMHPCSSTWTRRCLCVRRSPAWAMPSSFGYTVPPVYCIWIGGTTPAGSSRETVEGLVQSFPVALTELIEEAIAATREDGEMDSATAALATGGPLGRRLSG